MITSSAEAIGAFNRGCDAVNLHRHTAGSNSKGLANVARRVIQRYLNPRFAS
jgi:hypothetical protein